MYTSLYRHSLRNHHIRAIINLVTADSLIALQIFHYNRLSTFSGRLPTDERCWVCRAIRDERVKKKKEKKNRKRKKHLSFEFAISPVSTHKYTYMILHCHCYKYVRYLLDLILFIRLSYSQFSMLFNRSNIYSRLSDSSVALYMKSIDWGSASLFYIPMLLKLWERERWRLTI